MKFPLKKLLLLISVFAVVFFAAGNSFSATAHAATVIWTGNGADSNWSTAANWSSGSMPGASDVATFGGGCSSHCSPIINTSINVGGINLSGGSAIYSYYSSGTVGSYAGYFNGSNDYVALPASSILNVTGTITLSAWVKTTAGSNITFVGGYQNANPFPGYGFGIGLGCSSGVPSYWAGSSWVCSTRTVNDGNWHLVTVSADGTNASFYVDGALTNTASEPRTPSSYLGQRAIGSISDGSSEYLTGSIDDVRIYNIALSSSDVANIYSGSATSTGLVGEWDFESNANDSSGNGNTGTWNGTQSFNTGISSFSGKVTQATGTTVTIGSSGFTGGGGSYYDVGYVGAAAAGFNGSDNGFDTGQTFSGLTTFTVSLWVKTTNSASENNYWQAPTLFGKASGGSNSGDFGITMNNGYPGMWSGLSSGGGDNSFQGSTVINDNNWHLLTVANDGTNATLYLDGSAIGSMTTGKVLDNTEQFGIGARWDQTGLCSYGGMCYANATIDDVRVYNAALSSSSIASIFAGSATSSGLLAEWNFEGSANDSSGNGHTGAWHGTPSASYGTTEGFVGSGNASDTITINGGLTQSGGVFTSTAGNLTVTGNVVLNGGTFNNGGGVLTINNTYGNRNITCNGSPFHRISFTGNDQGSFTISRGCTIDLGANPTTYGTFINYGTIKVDSGTWTNNTRVGGYGGDVQNYGTIDASGATGWIWDDYRGDGLIQETSSSVVLYGGTSMTLTGDLNIALGTFPTGENITFNIHDIVGTNAITCNGSPFGIVTIGSSPSTAWRTVSAGCTIDLGANPTTEGGFINYGTIKVDSGTWTNNAADNSGWGGNTQNYGTIDASGATGWSWDAGGGNHPDGLIQETSTAVVLYGGTSMSFAGDLNIALGSFPTGKNIDFDANFGNMTVTCNGSPFGVVNSSGGVNTRLTVSAGCTINLGTNPSTLGSFFNYGTIVVASGTWTNNTWNNSGYGGDSENFGTIDASGATGWMWNGGPNAPDGLIQETTSSVVLYGGTSMTLTGDLNIALGTFPTGKNIVFYHVNGWWPTVTCNGSPFNIVSAVGSAASGLTISAGCTIDLGANPSTVGNFYNYGTIKVDSGTWTSDVSTWGGGGNSQNYGTIDASGATGWLWNGGNGSYPNGLIQETSTAVVTYGGTSMTFTGDLNIALGSFPTGKNIVFDHATNNSITQIVTCSGSPFGTVDTTGNGDNTLTVSAGCAIDLGANPTTNGGFINYGTITVDSGTWTNTAWNWGTYGGTTMNYGTINASGATGWLWNGSSRSPDGLVQETSTAVVTYGGSSMTLTGDLNIALGTFSSGVSVVFNHANDNQTLTCNAATPLGTVTVNGNNNNFYFNTSVPCIFTGDFDIYAGNVINPGSAYTVSVDGNYNQSNSGYTVGGSNLTIDMVGNATSTLYEGGGTFASNLAMDKTGITTIQLKSDFNVANGGTCAVNAGTFDLYSHNFTCSGALSVGSGGWLNDTPGYNSTITLGSTVTNNGVIWLDGSGPVCSTPYPNYVIINSSASGTQRAWSGSGEFVIRYAQVKDQAGTAVLNAYNGTNLGDNGSNWTFTTGGGRPQYIEKGAAYTGTATPPVTMSSFPYRPHSGDTILVAVSTYGEAALPPTDNAGDTYKLAASSTYGSPTTGLYLYYAENVSSTAPFTITLNGTGGGSQQMAATAYEFTGLAASGTLLDIAGTNVDQSGNAVTLTEGPITGYAASDELYFGLATAGTSSATLSPQSPWTGLYNIPSVANTQPSLSPEYQSLANVSQQTASWSASASTSYASMVAIFAPPGFQGSGYAASGTLDSVIFDTQSTSGAQLNSVVWSGDASNGTSVGIQLAVSNSSSGPWTFIGPSGDGTTYFIGAAGTPIPLVSNVGGAGYALFSGYRYFRYRTVLFSDIGHIYTPTVTGVNVNWSP